MVDLCSYRINTISISGFKSDSEENEGNISQLYLFDLKNASSWLDEIHNGVSNVAAVLFNRHKC
jgi:hypothetical protein